MSDKRGDGVTRAMASLAAVAASMGTRKLVTAGWKKVTGKEPPGDPQDTNVGIGEALGWAIVLGVTMESARVLVQRAAFSRLRRKAITSDDAK